MFEPCFGASTAKKLKKSCFEDSSEGAKKAKSRYLILWACPIFGSKNPKKNISPRELLGGFISAILWTPDTTWRLRNRWKSQQMRIFRLNTCMTPPRLLDCVILPEMGTWGVLEPFCTRNRYLNPFRSNLNKNPKIGFFEFFNCGWPQKWGRKIFYGSRNFDIEISTGLNTSKLI